MRHLPLLLLLACLLLSACAAMDDFLEIPLGEEPAVYFEAPVEPADHDTLVVAAVEGAEVIDGLTTRTLRLFLKTPNRKLTAVGSASPSVFLSFTLADQAEQQRLTAAHRSLAGRTLYLLCLHRMTVPRRAALPPTTTLSTATPVALSTRQLRRLANRSVDFLLLPIAPGTVPTTIATYAE